MLKQVLEIYELLDRATANGKDVLDLLKSRGAENTEMIVLEGPSGSCDFIRVIFKGTKGRLSGGSAPTLGVTGRLGGLGARPEITGFVSDGDGALAALALALKLADMAKYEDRLKGDVVITTHVCPNAPVIPHDPVPMMSCHINMETVNKLEVEADADAVLSIDTTKGNKIINHNGFAISCTVKDGYILKVSDDLVNIANSVGNSL